ncbi:MAG: hypothetical protein U0841_28025 [Chloroflexia bacterium]
MRPIASYSATTTAPSATPGAFRWAKPGASISIPVAAPATYAITLTMQDSPAVHAPRA